MDRRGPAVVEKEKMKMDDRKEVVRVISVLETETCGLFGPSDHVPRWVIFRYEGGGPDGRYSLVTELPNKEDSRKILAWLHSNADPDAFGCGLGNTVRDRFPKNFSSNHRNLMRR